MNGPTLTNIRRTDGIAGNYEIGVAVQYAGEEPAYVSFAGSVYGGPVVMITEHSQTFVSESVLDRIGHHLSPEWVERFFAESPVQP